MSLEAPDADSAEQFRDLIPDVDDDAEQQAEPEAVPLEADQADRAEQARALGLDDDEYR
jgi:hypothetical protein